MNRTMNRSTNKVMRISYVTVLVLILAFSIAGMALAAAAEVMP